MKTKFNIPSRDEVSPAHQTIYDFLTKMIGFVPNLYAALAHSENALSVFLTAQNSKSSLTGKEKEVVNLIVSQVNECAYCLSSHTILANRNGFKDDQILEIRTGAISFNPKLDALVKLTKSIAENKGHADTELIDQFIDAGYSKENLMDVIILVGIRSIANYTYAVTNVEIDWPIAPELAEA